VDQAALPALSRVDPAPPAGARADDPPVPAAALRVDERLVTVRAPRSFEAEQYRVLRHFLQGTGAERSQVIAVSSPAAGEGKTTTAVNLAATLAQSRGARVLVVDTDLRRPFVASALGLSTSGPGLVGALLDERLDLAAAVQRTPFNLAVLPAGPPPADAYHVLESPRLGRLLQQARAEYDHVVVDTPPLLVVPDCRLIEPWVDAFVVVVAAQRTPRRLLGEALAVVEPAKVAGIVFNGDARPLWGEYGGYYADYHAGRGERGGWRWWRRSRGQGRRSWR
jgi:capsular exopolysaccharide synthesis family protein